MSERRACRLVNQPRGTQRYQLTQREDEDALTQAIVELASQYGRYGYRRITALLQARWLAGWQGPGGAHLASRRAEGSAEAEAARAAVVQRWIVRAAAAGARNHVWSYDFVSARTHDGRTVRMLNLIDEHTRECLMIRPERRWSQAKVIEALADVMVMKGVPEHLRSDNGPEFVARDLRKWLADTGAKTLTSNRDVHGRTATARASTRSSEMSS